MFARGISEQSDAIFQFIRRSQCPYSVAICSWSLCTVLSDSRVVGGLHMAVFSICGGAVDNEGPAYYDPTEPSLIVPYWHSCICLWGLTGDYGTHYSMFRAHRFSEGPDCAAALIVLICVSCCIITVFMHFLNSCFTTLMHDQISHSCCCFNRHILHSRVWAGMRK